jgi:hypothetical protein
MDCRFEIQRLAYIVCTAAAAQAGILFQDNFTTPGSQLNLSSWTTEIGPPSFLGRTQLADWVTPGGVGQFNVGAGGAQLALQTHNPTGLSLYGTHGKTLQSFQPSANTTIEFTTRIQLQSIQPGIVFGMYLYGCPGPCATQHDEIDIEILTNSLQSAPYQVQLNRYANEPLGAGHGGLVNLPGGFNPLAEQEWTIKWSLQRIDYLLNGLLLASVTDHVPQGPMQANIIAWGPDSNWSAAYNASLQPVNSSGLNQSFIAEVRSVTVSESTIPEPGTWTLVLAGLALYSLTTIFPFSSMCGYGPPRRKRSRI